MINKLNRAFTLLEILVVIGIIGILIGLGAVSYSTAQKKARDAKRKSDLKTIQNAMEQCYSINTYQYPAELPVAGASFEAPCDSIITMPADPLGSDYVCFGTCDETGYTVCPPEVRTGHRLESEDCATDVTTCCVTNQQ